jgi:hypothetical protein
MRRERDGFSFGPRVGWRARGTFDAEPPLGPLEPITRRVRARACRVGRRDDLALLRMTEARS